MTGIRNVRNERQDAGLEEALRVAMARIAPAHRHVVLALAQEMGRRHPHPASAPALRLVQN